MLRVRVVINIETNSLRFWRVKERLKEKEERERTSEREPCMKKDIV